MSNSPERVFDFDDAEHRNQYLRSLGAENILPPLPRSKYVKIKASGRILPWDQLLAEQPTLVECCDVNGNTDPSAWMPDVEPGELSDEEQRLLVLKAQAQLFADADKKALDGMNEKETEKLCLMLEKICANLGC